MQRCPTRTTSSTGKWCQFPPFCHHKCDARLDIRARGFWRKGQNAFFDVRTTNADNASQKEKPIKSVLRNHEQEKKRQYNARVMEIEQGTFTPIIVTIKGVMGLESNRFHKPWQKKYRIKQAKNMKMLQD